MRNEKQPRWIPRSSRGTTGTVIFLGSLLIFTFGLHSQEVIGFDSRFYLFAQEMWRNGVSWFPTTYQQPYPDYPATSTFVINLFAHLLGGVNKFTAVLPSAIMAAITVMMTYQIGLLRNKYWGLFAAFFMLLTVAFVKSARSIALDMYPTMITACCFYLVCSAHEYKKPCRVWWVYPLLLLGFVFRGPIGLVMPAGVVFAYYAVRGLTTRSYRPLFLFGFIALCILLICTLMLLALASKVGGDTFMQAVLRMEVLGRLDNSYLPRSFYFTNSLGNYALSYPFALLTIMGVVYYYFKQKRLVNADFLMLLIAWMLVIMVGMSIPGDKKDRYILPMVPAIALLAAYPLIALPDQKYFRFLRALILRLFLYLPAIFVLGVEVVYLIAKPNGLEMGIHYTAIVIALIALQLASLWCCYRYINRVTTREMTTFLFAMLSFVVVNLMVIEPIELYVDRAHEFIVAIETQRVNEQAKLVFYREQPDSLPIKYVINMPVNEQPIFIETPAALVKFKEPAFIVTSESYFMSLPKEILHRSQILANDRVGHVRVVVFTLSQSSQNHL